MTGRSAAASPTKRQSRKLGFEKRTHKAWHHGHNVGTRPHQMDGAKLRLRLAGEMSLNPRLERLACQFDPQYPNHRDRWPSKYAAPVRVHGVIGRIEAGFLGDLAHDAAGEIEPAVPDIVGIGRAGRKIDAPGVGGVAAHFAEQERAVGRFDRAHAKTVEDACVGKTPIAPRQKTRKVRLEEVGAKIVAGAYRI